MEDLNYQSQHTTSSERMKPLKRPKTVISNETKRATKQLFEEHFIKTYSGCLSNDAILQAFVERHRCCEYLLQISRRTVYGIIGPLRERVNELDESNTPQIPIMQPIGSIQSIGSIHTIRPTQSSTGSIQSTQTAQLNDEVDVTQAQVESNRNKRKSGSIRGKFEEFILSYKEKIKYRKCLNHFMQTDIKLSFLGELSDDDIIHLLGSVSDWKELQQRGMNIEESSRTFIGVETLADNVNCNVQFPEVLYDHVKKYPQLYSTTKAAKPIKGENEWIKSQLAEISEKCSNYSCLTDVFADFLTRYPKLYFLSKLSRCDRHYRYGSFGDLKLYLNGVAKPRRKRTRITEEYELETQQHEGYASPLHNLSPESRRDIESVVYGANYGNQDKMSNLQAEQAMLQINSNHASNADHLSPSQLSSVNVALRRSPRNRLNSSNPSKHSFNIGGYPELEVDDDLIDSFFAPSLSAQIVMSPVDMRCNDDVGAASIKVPASGPRRSPRFTRPRAKTPPVLVLRRSPRLKKSVGRLSFP